MARQAWYMTVVCDSCGRTEKTTGTSSDPATAWQQVPLTGWYAYDFSGLAWRIQDPFGWNISDLCPDCYALPLPRLIERVTERSKELAGKHD